MLSARSGHLVAEGVAPVPAQLDGMRLAFTVAAALAVLTVALAAKLPRRAAAS